MTTSPTVDIVSRCSRQDRDAQRVLYEQFHQRVFALAYRIVGATDADDVTQQTFIKVFARISQFDGRSEFSTWLFRVATNECLQFLRAKTRRREVVTERFKEVCTSSRSSALEATELLQTALARIDPELRSLFVLREVERFDYKQLAETLEISEGTVASRLNRARKQLRQHLTDLGWEP